MSKPFVPNEFPTADDLNDLVSIYERSTSEVDVVSTVTETTVFSKTITGGHVSNNRSLRLRIVADYLNDSGSNRNVTIRVKLGGTTLATVVGSSVPASASRLPAGLEILIQARGATNAQLVSVRHPNFTSQGTVIESLPATAAVDTTVNQTLAVTVEHSAAHASLSWRKRGADLELR